MMLVLARGRKPAHAGLLTRNHSARHQPATAVAVHTTFPRRHQPIRRSYVSKTTDETKRPSFKGQMIESISARLAREKAERVRAAQQRQTSAGARNASMTFVLLTATLSAFYMGTKYPRDVDVSSTLPIDAVRLTNHKTSQPDMEAAWADLAAVVGPENVSTAEADLAVHANSDWSTHQETEHMPFCVVYPATTDEVAKVMRICHGRRIPVVGYSGGTSLEGQFAPTQRGICVDFARMDRIVALHAEDLDVVVQPGVGWEALDETLAEYKLFFPPDPGPGARIGGMIGTGCSGTNAYRYGTMREWVLGLTVVMADGTVIKTRQRPRKSSAGYDLTKLFIGSEGTLGLVTEATLKLAVRPPSSSVAVATFGSVGEGADCASRVVGDGVQVAAVEILDADQMRCINAAGTTSRTWQEAPTLFFKFAGTERAVAEQIATVQSLSRQAGGLSFDLARSKHEQAELWSARKEALWSAMANKKPGDRVWTTDVAVPISRLPEIIRETKDDFQRAGLRSTMVGHAGDGNFHMILLWNEADKTLAEACVHRMVKRAVEMEGTATGEHGVGLVKRDDLLRELGESTVDAMRKLKQAFDPLCLLNCDKVLRMQKPKKGEVATW